MVTATSNGARGMGTPHSVLALIRSNTILQNQLPDEQGRAYTKIPALARFEYAQSERHIELQSSCQSPYPSLFLTPEHASKSPQYVNTSSIGTGITGNLHRKGLLLWCCGVPIGLEGNDACFRQYIYSFLTRVADNVLLLKCPNTLLGSFLFSAKENDPRLDHSRNQALNAVKTVFKGINVLRYTPTLTPSVFEWNFIQWGYRIPPRLRHDIESLTTTWCSIYTYPGRPVPPALISQCIQCLKPSTTQLLVSVLYQSGQIPQMNHRFILPFLYSASIRQRARHHVGHSCAQPDQLSNNANNAEHEISAQTAL
ncbi:hypothetical protein ASPCAL02480 [Aspergillus calidoustus]|uniref:Uncharacterized protein n=1 Tax=Aspergillus calidoustus TaxID=454130 RepID=A0A0U5GSH3_ASPCI|nr:hypothetical protein ASPCAL02480 [Aspergillus calidoustus]